MNKCLSVLAVGHRTDGCNGDHPVINGVGSNSIGKTSRNQLSGDDDHISVNDLNGETIEDELVNEDFSEEEPKFESQFCVQQLNETEEVVKLFDERLQHFEGSAEFVASCQYPRTFVYVHDSNSYQNDRQTASAVRKVAVLQKSLFKNVPATIYFGMEKEEGNSL
jgi:hypothetical protein